MREMSRSQMLTCKQNLESYFGVIESLQESDDNFSQKLNKLRQLIRSICADGKHAGYDTCSDFTTYMEKINKCIDGFNEETLEPEMVVGRALYDVILDMDQRITILDSIDMILSQIRLLCNNLIRKMAVDEFKYSARSYDDFEKVFAFCKAHNNLLTAAYDKNDADTRRIFVKEVIASCIEEYKESCQ